MEITLGPPPSKLCIFRMFLFLNAGWENLGDLFTEYWEKKTSNVHQKERTILHFVPKHITFKQKPVHSKTLWLGGKEPPPNFSRKGC